MILYFFIEVYLVEKENFKNSFIYTEIGFLLKLKLFYCNSDMVHV